MSRPLEMGWKHFPLRYYLCGNPAWALIGSPQGIMGKVISPFWRLSHILCFKSLWQAFMLQKEKLSRGFRPAVDWDILICRASLSSQLVTHSSLQAWEEHFWILINIFQQSLGGWGGFSCLKKKSLIFLCLWFLSWANTCFWGWCL